jgi:hypothetical protein
MSHDANDFTGFNPERNPAQRPARAEPPGETLQEKWSFR